MPHFPLVQTVGPRSKWSRVIAEKLTGPQLVKNIGSLQCHSDNFPIIGSDESRKLYISKR